LCYREYEVSPASIRSAVVRKILPVWPYQRMTETS